MNKLKERKEKFHYLGDLSKYQLKLQETEYVKYKTESYTEYQNYLYKRALYGLNALAEKELNNICNKKRGRINKVYVKGQIAINLYKQKITNDKSNKLFEKFFPHSKITKYLVNHSEVDKEFKNTLTFKTLDINKEHIISIFIKNGILAKNFRTLRQDPNKLPRLKSEG